MKLYLIRHGVAGSRASFARTRRPDSERPLTPEGRDKMSANAHGLRVLVKSLDAILSSPYARAAETADIVADVFKGPRPEPLEALAPGGRREEVLARLCHGHARSIAIVGHEPDLSSLLAWFVAGSSTGFGELKKGGVAMLAWDTTPAAGEAKLHWLASPKLLRRLVR